MLSTKVVEKIKRHILWSIMFFRKSCRIPDNVEKMRDVKATDITRRVRFACRIAKTIDVYLCDTYYFSAATILCERALVLRYTHITVRGKGGGGVGRLESFAVLRLA
jgi:hypothetical protein